MGPSHQGNIKIKALRCFALFSFLGQVALISIGALGAEQKADLSRPAAGRPALLSVPWLDPDMARLLRENGFEVNVARPEELTWEQLQKFNVVVLNGLEASNPDLTLPPGVSERQQLYQRFLDQGGGIWIQPYRGEQFVDIPPIWEFLKRYGARVALEDVSETDEVVATAWNIRFAYTDNIAAFPITEGIKGIWYPVSNRGLGGLTHLMPLIVDETWQVVVRGSRQSSSKPYQIGVPEIDMRSRQQGYSSQVPILAIREVGKGRLALCGIAPDYTFTQGFNPTLEEIVLRRGLRDKPSDLCQLILNILQWLAEPSLRAGTFGGATTPPEILRPRNYLDPVGPYDWSKAQFPPMPPSFKGLIGLRTSLSVGKGRVADYVSEAKKHGFSFLVFLEDFKKLTPEKFERLKQECREATRADFLALPGFTIEDKLGNHYFAFAENLNYPTSKLLTSDGKYFGGNEASTRPEEDFQLSRTILEYTHTIAGHRLTFGTYLHNRNAVPFYDFRNYDAVAVVTQENGRILEDFTAGFLVLTSQLQNPLPLALTFLDAPEGIARAAQGYVTVVQAPSPAAVAEKFSFMQYLASPTQYVTNGPQIEEWRWIGPRDYENHNDEFDLTWYRWRLRLSVSSEKGLKEVRIMDGTKLFRRFLPQGAKRFQYEFELMHDRQKNLVVLVQDMAGGRAISAEAFDRNHRLEEFYCSDRNNPLTYGRLRKSNGQMLLLGGNQCLGTPYKGPYNSEISPSGAFKNDALLGAPAFDGAAGGEPKFFFEPVLYVKEGNERRLHVRAERVLHSADVHIGEARTDGGFPDDVTVYNVWHTLWKLEPTRFFEFRERRHFFNVRPDEPLAVFLWERTLILKRSVAPKEGAPFLLMTGFLYPGMAESWTLRDRNGRTLSGTWQAESTEVLSGDFGHGAYIAFLGSPLGGAAVFSLTDGLQFHMSLSGGQRAEFGFPVPKEGKIIPAGTRFAVRLLLLGIPRTAPQRPEFIDQFARQLGLIGKPTYRLDLRYGKVIDQTYCLTVNGLGKGLAGTIYQANLVAPLPIKVTGLNDRWSVGLYDRIKKRYRPIGCAEGAAYAIIDTKEGNWNLFVGHPFVCDQPKVFLTTATIQTGEFLIEIHNPTDVPLVVTVRPAASLGISGILPFKVKVPPGASVKRKILSVP